MCTVKVQHVTHLQVNCGTTSNDDTRYLVKFGKIYMHITITNYNIYIIFYIINIIYYIWCTIYVATYNIYI